MQRQLLMSMLILIATSIFSISHAEDEYGYDSEIFPTESPSDSFDQQSPDYDYPDYQPSTRDYSSAMRDQTIDDDRDYYEYQDSPSPKHRQHRGTQRYSEKSYMDRLPEQIKAPGEKVIVIDPKVHAFGAYTPEGKLIYAGLATAGAKWCKDVRRPCRTRTGSFRIFSLGDSECISSIYPLGEGGAPMPYCMFFNGGQGIHGSNGVVEGNVSHGCVRLREADAAWLRYEFAKRGTKVVIKPYE